MITTQVVEVTARYLSALRQFLGDGTEPHLRQAYEIGRGAIADGLGILDVLAVHRRALGALAPADAARANDFLAECLSPFEMIHRGFRDANVQLKGRLQSVEETQRAVESRFRKIFHHSADAILVTRLAHGEILDANARACSMFGCRREHLLRSRLSDLFADPGRVAAFTQAVIERGDGWSEELVICKKSGSGAPAEVAGSLVDIDGAPCLLALVRDISERRRVEQLKREFIATVSHELRTPVTSIRGALGIVVGGAAGTLPKHARDLVEVAHRNSDRLVTLINDILDIERIHAGAATFTLRSVDLVAVAEQAIGTNRSYAGQFDVALVLSPPPEGGARVLADVDRLLQVMTNLISNAVKFSKRGGVVKVAVQRLGDAGRVSVTDRGCGIPEELRAHLFQKYVRTEAGPGGGSGLGLSISKAIVERLGGRIDFESVVGSGSTFFFELPLEGPR